MGQPKRRYTGKYLCEIPGCDREAQVSGLCHPCYAADLYWANKTVAQRRRRLKQVRIFEARMEQFSATTLRSVK